MSQVSEDGTAPRRTTEGELPQGWARAPIGSLCSLVNGRAFKPTEWQAQGVPIVRIQNLNNVLAPYNHFQGDLDERHRLNGGELLFAWSGTPGTSFGAHIWKGGAAALNQHIFRVDFDSSLLDKRFFRFAINERLNDLIGVAQGGVGLRHVTKGVFEETEVLVPPRAEQSRIADKLDALLARVYTCSRRLDRAPGILKRFRQSLLAAATSGELTREWREERGLRIDGWTRAAVGQIIHGIEAGLNVQCEERPPADSERGLVKISAVTWGTYDDNESKTLPPSAEVPERSRIRTGDFLISRANTLELVGACVIVHRVTRPVFLSDKILRLVMPEEWKPWLHLVLQSPEGRREIENRASGNQLSMRNLSQANLREIGVPIPTPEERAEIVRRVKSLLALADGLERRCRAEQSILGKLTPSILAKTFRGELVPQDPEDEPASVLLARIAAERSAPATSNRPRAPHAGRPPRAPKETAAMTKSRQDDDVMDKPYLAAHLHRIGSPTSAEALFKVAELPVADFYKQLAWEVAQGHVKDNQTTLEPGHAAG